MTHLAIVKVSPAGRIEKYQDYPTEVEALAHVDRVKEKFPAAYAALHPGGSFTDWLCDPIAKTAVLSPPPPPPNPTIISYEAFQGRFTAAEMDAVTKFVDAVDLVTGESKRPRLKQALARSWAKNNVDLADARTVAFMDALVAGGAVTQARRNAILVP